MSVKSICWNCQNIIPPNIFLCQKCNKIQPPKQLDEFKLLGISEKFDLDLEELENAYLKLTTVISSRQIFTTFRQRNKIFNTFIIYD